MDNLFWKRNPYAMQGTDALFLRKLIKNVLFQFDHCEDYRRILLTRGFTREKLQNLTSPEELPFLPTLYFKHHHMLSVPEQRLKVKASSSGTSGNKSFIGFDLKSLWSGLGMLLAMGRYHRLFSPIPSHYIILGYEYTRHEDMAIMKTTYGQTWFTPTLSRTYALAYKNKKYVFQPERIRQRLTELSRQRFPVRITGFPYYTWILLNEMKKEHIHFTLPRGSLVMLGGGWKQHYSQKADKEAMYQLIYEVLGIPKENCLEFFSAVEHPVLYCTCPEHHFHVPIYSRVIIRDVDTYEPVPYGTPGLVTLITPMVNSVPLASIMTDDIGILHDGSRCGCKIQTPYLEILGRVGIDDITTCAKGAENL